MGLVLGAEIPSQLGRDLVWTFRARAFGEQPAQARGAEGGVAKIEGLSAESEPPRHLARMVSVHVMGAKHLVLDLDQVVSVEEQAVPMEKRIHHSLGMRVLQARRWNRTVPKRVPWTPAHSCTVAESTDSVNLIIVDPCMFPLQTFLALPD
jgi:hypothetical protein